MVRQVIEDREFYIKKGEADKGRATQQRDRSPLDPLTLDRTIQVPDYTEPFWLGSSPLKFEDHPPTWIAAVGRDGYWPLGVVGETTFKDDPARGLDDYKSAPAPKSTMVKLIPYPGPTEPKLKESQTSHYELQLMNGGPSSPPAFRNSLSIHLPLPWIVVCIFAIVLLVYQNLGILGGSDNQSDGLFSIFRPNKTPAYNYLLGIGYALAVMLLLETIGLHPQFFALLDGHALYFKWVFWTALALLIFAMLTPASLPKRNLAAFSNSYLAGLVIFVLAYYHCFSGTVSQSTTIALVYRAVHLTDGVSPLVPILCVTFGFYLWNWQAIAGDLIVASGGQPTLPKPAEGIPPKNGRWKWNYTLIRYRKIAKGAGSNLLCSADIRISQAQGADILRVAHPLWFSLRIMSPAALIFLGGLACFYFPENLPLLSLEGSHYNRVINGILLLAMMFTATEAMRLYSTWVNLRTLLHALGRLRLRRTIARLRPIQANSIWSVSGNVHRVQYDLFLEQCDAANRLIRLLPNVLTWLWLTDVPVYSGVFMEKIETSRGPASWETKVEPLGRPKQNMRTVLSDATGEIYNKILRDAWHHEEESLNFEETTSRERMKESESEKKSNASAMPLSKDPRVCVAEEFVAFHYIAFIQNIIARMRTMTLSMIFLFVSVCFAISFYPFVPRTEITVWLVLNLALIAGAVAYVYAQMERDEILSYIANTPPGRLGAEFWVKLSGFLAGPVIGILTTQFPSIADTVLQWLQPGLDVIK